MKKIINKSLTNYNQNQNQNQNQIIYNYGISILNYTKIQIYFDLIKIYNIDQLKNNVPNLNNYDKGLLLDLGIIYHKDISNNLQYGSNILIQNINEFKINIIDYLGIIIDNYPNNTITNNYKDQIEDLIIIIEKLVMYRYLKN
jgi:hypothetical protein